MIYTPATSPLQSFPDCSEDEEITTCDICWREAMTLPAPDTRDYARLVQEANFTKKEAESYRDFVYEISYPEDLSQQDGTHRVLGHASPAESDMQLNAQLVMNGIFCGDSSGYAHPRVAELEKGADDWILLLQLDSDERGGLKWADIGEIYFWIHRDHLALQKFDRVWLTLESS